MGQRDPGSPDLRTCVLTQVHRRPTETVDMPALLMLCSKAACSPGGAGVCAARPEQVTVCISVRNRAMTASCFGIQ